MRLAVCAALAVALSGGGAALAQETRGDEYNPAALTAPQESAGETAPVFGSGNNLLQIPSSSFTVRDSTTVFQQDGFGYTFATSSPSVTTFWAPVDLPAGVIVDRLGLYSFDNDPANQITARFQRYDGTTAPATTAIASVVSAAGVPMYGYANVAMNHQIDNNASAAGHHYMILIDIPVRSNLLRFRSVELQWHRVVSAAPATATFPTDVPTSHPFFRFIEALARSGISGGCGASSFCPDDPVTRGQMAVFMAAALGLHFPN